MRGLAVLLAIFAVQAAFANPLFKSFAGRKVQLSRLPVAGDHLLLLVNDVCLGSSPAVRQKAAQAIAGKQFSVQHKSSSDLPVKAIPLRAEADLSWPELNRIAGQPCVEGLTRNSRFYITASDERLGEQQGFRSAIGHPEAERIFFHPIYGLNQPATVAVVDTGVQANHPDLQSRMWRNSAGEVGYDFFNGDNDPDDDNGHGTHVAGLIGAQRENGIGVRGVMGHLSRLMAVKTQSKDGGGFLGDLINGITWAADQGADVINVSIAGNDKNPALVDALEYALAKNATVVVASGNEGQEITAGNLITPIGYARDLAGLIGVGAFDALSFARPAFSNFSPSYVEIAAPGASGISGILSTFYQSRYIALDGTSMSAPQVSGAAALAAAYLKTHNRQFTPAMIEQLILQSAVRDAGLTASYQEGRRLNVKRLGELLLHTTVLDSSGGFDGP